MDLREFENHPLRKHADLGMKMLEYRKHSSKQIYLEDQDAPARKVS